MTRILIYEDTDSYRENLADLLRTDKRRVVGRSDCRYLREQVEQHRPDLVLFDIDMPHVDGLQGLYLLKQHFPLVRALMLTIFDETTRCSTPFALAPTATCSNTRRQPNPRGHPGTLRRRRAHDARHCPKGAATFSQSWLSPKTNLQPHRKRTPGACVARGWHELQNGRCRSGREINTVRTHVMGVYQKLSVHSVSEAVGKAIREQIV